MSKKEVVPTAEAIGIFNDYTNRVIEEFLSYYSSKASKKTYRSAINIMLLDILAKEAADITFSDYNNVVSKDEGDRNTQSTYRESFIKFLYGFGLLKNEEGFSSRMLKDDIVAEFNRLKNRGKVKVKRISPNEPLTLPEFMAIEEVLNKDFTKLEMQKIEFCWHMLYQEGCSVEELKEIKSIHLQDGKVITDAGNTFEVPSKFHPMFEDLNSRETRYNGFFTANKLIKDLGEIANLDRKLTPFIIKKTRNENILKCSNCSESYENKTQNWASVNGRIVCFECADDIKKKLNLADEDIPTTSVKVMSSEQEAKVEASVYTFGELARNFKNKPINYLELHERLMEIGLMGEIFVYESECKKLSGTKYEEMVNREIAEDPTNGYDILSYERDGTPLHIEVKTTTSNKDQFFLSKHELDTAKKFKEQDKKHVVYFVKNILSNEPTVERIKDIAENTNFIFEETNYKVTKNQ
ncbi:MULTISPECIES: DUF3883 domain-containing protein [Bacillaceae]|nr:MULTISPECIES: DUF3883 domain-containing protein [Bacillaceae]MCA1203336.1 DUF3883 domain-containing protein [Priestia flexa]